MYAVVNIAGHQVKVDKGQRLRVPRLQAEEGSTQEFNRRTASFPATTRPRLAVPRSREPVFRRRSSAMVAATRLSFSRRNGARNTGGAPATAKITPEIRVEDIVLPN